MVLYVHCELTDNLNLVNVVNSFAGISEQNFLINLQLVISLEIQ